MEMSPPQWDHVISAGKWSQIYLPEIEQFVWLSSYTALKYGIKNKYTINCFHAFQGICQYFLEKKVKVQSELLKKKGTLFQ